MTDLPSNDEVKDRFQQSLERSRARRDYEHNKRTVFHDFILIMLILTGFFLLVGIAGGIELH